MNKESIKTFISNFITIITLSIVCHIIDFAMVFFDHRFLVGIIVAALIYEPVLEKVKSKI